MVKKQKPTRESGDKRTIIFTIKAKADYHEGNPPEDLMDKLKNLQEVANELYQKKGEDGKHFLEEYFNQYIYDSKSFLDNLKFESGVDKQVTK